MWLVGCVPWVICVMSLAISMDFERNALRLAQEVVKVRLYKVLQLVFIREHRLPHQ